MFFNAKCVVLETSEVASSNPEPYVETMVVFN